MARLIVEAVFNQLPVSMKGPVHSLDILLTVSNPEDGKPVTGLDKSNFRALWAGLNLEILIVEEYEWIQDKLKEPTGQYRVNVGNKLDFKFKNSLSLATIGFQVRRFTLMSISVGSKIIKTQVPVDFGQTVAVIPLAFLKPDLL